MSIFNVGISGLNAAQVGIQTTSHNIANASTDGYNRQQIIQSTLTPMFTGAGFLGQGTSVETVRRVYNQHLSSQMLSAQSGAAAMDSYLAQIQQVDNLLADPDAGLSPALSNFFAAVQEMAAYPASLPARQAMLSASQSLVARFQAIDQRLEEVRTGVNNQIASTVTEINAYAQQIADINQHIILAQAVGPNQPANDLLDQRDQLISELNARVRVTTLTQDDGTYSVFVGNGQPLVVGAQSLSMRAIPDPLDSQRTIVALQSPNGASVVMPESLLTGGALGGLLAFRRESLDDVQDDLGLIAEALARDFNRQHQMGQDLDGDLGGLYFVDASTLGSPARAANLALAIGSVRDIAVAAPIRTRAAIANTGTGTISAGVVTDATNASLRTTTTLNFVAGGYQVNGAGPVIAYSTGTPIDLNGWRVTITGTPAVGDVFTIESNTGGVSDSRNALLLGALQTSNTLSGGSATYQSAYSAIVAQVGNKTREVEVTGAAQQSLYDQARTAHEEISGVNLDEEAANLLRYQQAYQAAAKMIDVASKLFDEILALGR